MPRNKITAVTPTSALFYSCQMEMGKSYSQEWEPHSHNKKPFIPLFHLPIMVNCFLTSSETIDCFEIKRKHNNSLYVHPTELIIHLEAILNK
jgi:hypothetical protein